MWIFKRFLANRRGREPKQSFEQYELGMPTNQSAVDAVPGWSSAFPPEKGVTAGKLPLYNDDRVDWALRTFGPLGGKDVLEVGPLEGMHTFMLDRAGAQNVDAVEANRQCYLRCLITKQIMGINNANFWLGDIQHWLVNTDKSYDLALASGVLYHMADPVEFLQQLAARSRAIFLWTHFYYEPAMPDGDPRRTPFTGAVKQREFEGSTIRYYERRYHQANTNASFCGGSRDIHNWMHRDDILDLLRQLGFANITIRSEELDHPGGPCFTLLARREGGV